MLDEYIQWVSVSVFTALPQFDCESLGLVSIHVSPVFLQHVVPVSLLLQVKGICKVPKHLATGSCQLVHTLRFQHEFPSHSDIYRLPKQTKAVQTKQSHIVQKYPLMRHLLFDNRFEVK